MCACCRLPLASLLAAILMTSMGSSIVSATLNSTDNVAVYWGQNSYGQGSGPLAQQSLATYCADSDIDMIQMAFMVQVTSGVGNEPVLNFANQQNNCTLFDGTDLINCPLIGADMKTCQQTYGKKLLLSIGGSTYTEGGFTSEAAAISAANMLWASFGPLSPNATSSNGSLPSANNGSASGSIAARGIQNLKRVQSSILRPFGDAVIDGFDFDFETTTQNTKVFAQQLRTLMDKERSKEFYLTAAPQCPYPDAADNNMLNGGVPFDAVFVQFYNNYCGVQSFSSTSNSQNNFDFSTWDTWAKNGSANPNVKIFLGVPAGPSAAGSGYKSVDDLSPIIQYCKGFQSFGGVMMWDASQAYANNGFLSGVKTALRATSGTRRVRRKLEQSWKA